MSRQLCIMSTYENDNIYVAHSVTCSYVPGAEVLSLPVRWFNKQLFAPTMYDTSEVS